MKSKQLTAVRCTKIRATSGKLQRIGLRPQRHSSTLDLTGVRLDYAVFDAEYIARLRRRDEETEMHFTSYFSNAIWLKLRNRVRARHLIDEIRQDTFARVLNYLQSGQTIQFPERFGAFVQGVCTNVMLETMRKESAHPAASGLPLDPPDHRVKFDVDIVTEERKQLVREVLSELTEKDRTLLRMVYLEDVDRAEVRRSFKVDGDYLRVLLHRAKDKFREAARKKGFDGWLQ